jgi:hypothetical protein
MRNEKNDSLDKGVADSPLGMTLDCQYLSSCVRLWGLFPRFDYVGVFEHCSNRLGAIEI